MDALPLLPPIPVSLVRFNSKALTATSDELPDIEMAVMVGLSFARFSPLRIIGNSHRSGWRLCHAHVELHRYRAGAFKHEFAQSIALRNGLSRYAYVLMSQLATSAACLRYHEIGPRLARWLLMSQDRAHADRFRVTQEFLAYMLGVRRVGVTRAASKLQRAGHIRYRLGVLTVLDRAGLEAAACDCYAADRKSYAEVLQWPT